MNHEEATIKAFILPERRERYLGFLSTRKGREKFRSELAHFKALDPRWIVSIPPNQQNPSSLARILAAKGASSRCWLISEDSKFDAQEMELEEALRETVGGDMGTFIICVPGKLAYFENEEDRYILQR